MYDYLSTSQPPPLETKCLDQPLLKQLRYYQSLFIGVNIVVIVLKKGCEEKLPAKLEKIGRFAQTKGKVLIHQQLVSCSLQNYTIRANCSRAIKRDFSKVYDFGHALFRTALRPYLRKTSFLQLFSSLSTSYSGFRALKALTGY